MQKYSGSNASPGLNWRWRKSDAVASSSLDAARFGMESGHSDTSTGLSLAVECDPCLGLGFPGWGDDIWTKCTSQLRVDSTYWWTATVACAILPSNERPQITWRVHEPGFPLRIQQRSLRCTYRCAQIYSVLGLSSWLHPVPAGHQRLAESLKPDIKQSATADSSWRWNRNKKSARSSCWHHSGRRYR